jgi:serine/threonine-protein kinase RsbW
MCDTPATILNLDIQIPNQTRYLGLIGNITELIAKEIDAGGLDREALAYNLNLVVTEAVTNAIQYGSPADNRDCVRILLSYEKCDLCVRVFDHGEGFDLARSATPEVDQLHERGRGLYFIRTLMDSVEYRRAEGGNVLEMRKKLR